MREIRTAKRMEATGRSAIRELLKLSSQPGLISFGGGYPAPETFPAEAFARFAQLLPQNRLPLKYGLTEGSLEFRKACANWLKQTEGLDINPQKELMTTSASQQGLDLIAKAYLNPKDIVFCGLPTYLGAISAFRLMEAKFIGIPLELDGWKIDVFEKALQSSNPKKQKLAYVVPDAQNPSGITWSQTKRQKLVDLAEQHNLLIIEDQPYRWLCEDEPPPMFQLLDKSKQVITLITFSKIFAPGLRLGTVIGAEDLLDPLIRAKQGTDLCTSELSQFLAKSYLENCEMSQHIDELKQLYCHKRNVMLRALEEAFEQTTAVHWTNPNGGLFVWLTLPQGINASAMLQDACKNKVAYVPGEAFFVDGRGKNCLRLCFSEVTDEEIVQGINRLAQVINTHLESSSVASLPI